MSTVKQHLTQMHEAAAEHQSALAKGHRKLAKCFKASGIESAEDVALAHEGIAKTHDDAAVSHLEMCKAIGVEDLTKADQLVPDRVSAVVPAFPTNVRAVPRIGQREISKAAEDVPVEFRSLVEVDDTL
jgi:hypothetical protein